MIKGTTLGRCPKCGSDELTYGNTELIGECMGYEFTCESCGAEGTEWYNLTYTESIIYDED